MNNTKLCDVLSDIIINITREQHRAILYKDQILSGPEVISLLDDARKLLRGDFVRALDTITVGAVSSAHDVDAGPAN